MKLKYFEKVVSFLLLVIIATAGCGSNSELKGNVDVKKLVEKEEINDLSLTIYYMDSRVLTNMPLDVEHLMNNILTKKIVVSGSDLEKNLDLLKKINLEELTLIKEGASYYLDARVYYILESKSNGQLLEVVIGGFNPDEGKSCAWLNGYQVENCAILYDVILPFLPEEPFGDIHFLSTFPCPPRLLQGLFCNSPFFS